MPNWLSQSSVERRDVRVLLDGRGEDGQVEQSGRAEWLAEDADGEDFGGWLPEASRDVEHQLVERADPDERARPVFQCVRVGDIGRSTGSVSMALRARRRLAPWPGRGLISTWMRA
jgi:hypothetical protein